MEAPAVHLVEVHAEVLVVQGVEVLVTEERVEVVVLEIVIVVVVGVDVAVIVLVVELVVVDVVVDVLVTAESVQAVVELHVLSLFENPDLPKPAPVWVHILQFNGSVHKLLNHYEGIDITTAVWLTYIEHSKEDTMRLFVAVAALAASVSLSSASVVEITTTLDGQKYQFSTCRSAAEVIRRVGLHGFVTDGPRVVADSSAPDGWHDWANAQEPLTMKSPLPGAPAAVGALCR